MFGLKKKVTAVKEEIKVAETSEAKVMLNDNKSIPAIIKVGRTYVRVREIAELLELKIVYESKSKTTKLYGKNDSKSPLLIE